MGGRTPNKVPEEPIMMTEEERIAAEKAAEKLRRKREYNRKYMKKIREKSKRFKDVGGRHHEQPHGGVRPFCDNGLFIIRS